MIGTGPARRLAAGPFFVFLDPAGLRPVWSAPMSNPTEEQILNALRQVQDPDLHKDIVTLNFIKDLKITGGKVAFKIELTTPACPVKDLLKAQAESVVKAIAGVSQVDIEMTAMVRAAPGSGENLIPGVKNTIAVASGKGGVGKSTVSTNLALALAATGAKVGLLDADIYGPNIPQMMGIDETPKQEGQKIHPAISHGVPIMSMAFMISADQPVIWRGPMLHGALRQFLSQVVWGELDYLIIDMPPGTGDVQLSLSQLIPLTGAVIVTTPQQISLSDVKKGVAMFQQVKVPILGIVENMAGFICAHCDKETPLFPGKGGEELAKTLNVAFLGRLPFDPRVGIGGDNSEPILLHHPTSAVAQAFSQAAGLLAREVAKVSWEKSHGALKLGQIRL